LIHLALTVCAGSAPATLMESALSACAAVATLSARAVATSSGYGLSTRYCGIATLHVPAR
jgi:hypothetical protein